MTNIIQLIPEKGTHIAICFKKHIEVNHPLAHDYTSSNGQIQREIEKKGAELLIKELTGKDFKVQYRMDGSPYLKQTNEKISISHSKELIAVCLGEKSVGIDIEEISVRALKVAKRFLSPFEQQMFISERQTTMAWTIKEALYKICHTKGLHFQTDLRIIKELEKDKAYLCEVPIHGSLKKVVCKTQEIHKHILTYTSHFE